MHKMDHWKHIAEGLASQGMVVQAADYEEPMTQFQLDPGWTSLVLGKPTPIGNPGELILRPWTVNDWTFKWLIFGGERHQVLNAKRGPGAEIQHGTFAVAEDSGILERYSFKFGFDLDQIRFGDARIGMAEKCLQNARSIVEMAMEYDRATLLTTAASYTSGNNLAISAGSEWNDSTPGDPKEHIRTVVDAITAATGVEDEDLAVFLPRESYQAAIEHADFISFKETASSGLGIGVTGLSTKAANLALLAAYFEVGRVWTMNKRYMNTEGVMVPMYGDVAIVYYDGDQSSTAWDNSQGRYEFGRSAMPNRGLAARPYVEENTTMQWYPWHGYLKPIITNPDLAGLITNTLT